MISPCSRHSSSQLLLCFPAEKTLGAVSSHTKYSYPNTQYMVVENWLEQAVNIWYYFFIYVALCIQSLLWRSTSIFFKAPLLFFFFLFYHNSDVTQGMKVATSQLVGQSTTVELILYLTNELRITMKVKTTDINGSWRMKPHNLRDPLTFHLVPVAG